MNSGAGAGEGAREPGPVAGEASRLVPCPACARPLSTAAAACPECGHPMRAAAPVPSCHACEAPATTRCQRCGVLSCALHLRSIYVHHGRGGAYELRCATCFSSAEAAKSRNLVLGVVLVVVMLVVVCSILMSERKRAEEASDRPLPTYPLPPK